MTNENNTKKVDGMPDISEKNNRNKSIVLAAMSLVVAICFSTYLYSKIDNKSSKPQEEIYTIATDSPNIKVEDKKDQPVAEKDTSDNKQVSQEVLQQQMILIQEKQKELQQRLSSPLMIVNASQTRNKNGAEQQAQDVSEDANTKFMNQVSAQSQKVASATNLGPLNNIVAEGALIHAILESSSNSDLPGYLRASVSEPVYSEDGTVVLIPPGSRLIGQYKSGVSQGQSRIFVVWTRLITPRGISIQLGSEGVDSLGVAGIGADEINRHFWERFGTASLLSLLGAGAANAGINSQDQNNSAASYREAVANSFMQTADQTLQQDSKISPTLKTYQGKPIVVFVARDLHFQNAMNRIHPKINVY